MKRRRPTAWTKKSKEHRKLHDRCAICGKTLNLDVHHILDWTFWPEFQYDDRNLITLCKKHHKFGRFSAHKHPVWFSNWLMIHRPDVYRAILEMMRGREEEEFGK